MSVNKPSSFQSKQTGKFIKIKGTKSSPHNAQLLVSSGIPSLDHILGGGIPVGSIILIEEDSYSKYSKVLLKYFLAEGAVNDHGIYVASSTIQPKDLIKELPGLITEEKKSVSSEPIESNSDKMKIAWRYQKLDAVKSSVENSSFGHYYDLTQNLQPEFINNIDINTYENSEYINNASHQTLDGLISSLEEVLGKECYRSCNKGLDISKEYSVLRIGVNSLGSPLWSSEPLDNYINSLPLYLLKIKALVRASFSVAFVTVPVDLLKNFEGTGIIRKLEQIADNVIHLESFMGSKKEKNPLYKDYHGLFHIKKFAQINSLCCHVPHAFDLAFKLKRKSFTIETLHLPPDLSETVNRSQASAPVAKNSCSAASGQGFSF